MNGFFQTLVVKLLSGQIRNLIATGAGLLLAHGFVTNDESAKLIEEGTSVVILLLNAAWSWWDHHRQHKDLGAAVQVAATATGDQVTVAGVTKVPDSRLLPPSENPQSSKFNP